MGATAIDQRNSRLLAATDAITKFSRQFKPSGASTNNNDVAKGTVDYFRRSEVGSPTRISKGIAAKVHLEKYLLLRQAIGN
jgi:hypothetical protein